jgi:ABC-type multidrug transport system fused ATPase/permease subunit
VGTTTESSSSAVGFIGGLLRERLGGLLLSIAFGAAWVLSQALFPLILGWAIDAVGRGRGSELLLALAALALIVVTQSVSGSLNYRASYLNYLRCSLELGRRVGAHASAAGRALTRARGAGEVVVTATSDAQRVGRVFDLAPRMVGAVLAWAVVTALMFRSSAELGVLALISVPVACGALALLVGPLDRRQSDQRTQLGSLSALGSDAAGGLRVLRGIGGEEEFVDRYVAQSQEVRHSGVRAGGLQSWLLAAQVLFPGAIVAMVTAFGARLVLDGRWSAGDLVTAYGYSVFLLLPISTGVEAILVLTAAVVSARRVLEVLQIPALVHSGGEAPVPARPAELLDESSGLRVRPGALTAVVAVNPDDAAAVAERLGRYDNSGRVLWDGIDQVEYPLDALREHIVVAGATPHLFSGTLLSNLDIRRSWDAGAAKADRIAEAVYVAAATEIIDSRPHGLGTVVNERGRSFSGGERQRLSLARALLTDAEVLVLIEPTSAVDSVTEQLIADRLAAARAGRTTVLATESPLLLRHAQVVALLDDGKVVAEGRHDELLEEPGAIGTLYRSVVLRGMEAADAAPHR